jgi:hypothetical protein
MNNAWAIIAVLAIVAVPAMALVVLEELLSRRARRHRLMELKARPVMAKDDWYDLYWGEFSVSYGATVAVSDALSHVLGCDSTQLRPSDRFDGSLSIRSSRWALLDRDDVELEVFEEEILTKMMPGPIWEKLRKEEGSICSLGDLVGWYDRVVCAGPGLAQSAAPERGQNVEHPPSRSEEGVDEKGPV